MTFTKAEFFYAFCYFIVDIVLVGVVVVVVVVVAVVVVVVVVVTFLDRIPEVAVWYKAFCSNAGSETFLMDFSAKK